MSSDPLIDRSQSQSAGRFVCGATNCILPRFDVTMFLI
jgi:hypothetical protein